MACPDDRVIIVGIARAPPSSTARAKPPRELTPLPDMSIPAFIKAIERLPPGKPVTETGAWYRTQKEHWLGWLSEYQGPGFYGRLPGTKRNARLAYNRIVNPQMLVWLIDAAGLGAHLPESARAPVRGSSEMTRRSGLLRRHVPWEAVAQALRLPPDA